jgi:flagellar basal-body rod protein FlgF
VYTRNGNFQISKTNHIETSEGYTLRNVLDKGNAMTVDPTEPITIDKDGIVAQGAQQIGQIEVSEIPSASNGVSKLGNSYFSLNLGAPSSAQGTEILQGQLEQSNVPVAESAVRLVSVMRQFEMLQKAMNLTSQMNKEAIQEVAKVG